MKLKILTGLVCAAALTAGGVLQSQAMSAEEFSPNVDKEGNISLPEDFRISMIHQWRGC